MKNIVIKIVGVMAIITFIIIMIVISINKNQIKNDEIVMPIANLENQNIIFEEPKIQEKDNNIEMRQEINTEEVNEVTQTETRKDTKEKIKQETNTKTKQVTKSNKVETKEENKQEKQKEIKTETKEKTDKQEQTSVNEKLANTTYRKVNNEVVPKIINILNDEIAKHEELKKYETKAIKASKEQVYNNTKGFTYMFVKSLEKGKVSGNYTVFEERVRNTVGAFGKYQVYAEDEYKYDSTGSKSYWYQTLVWVYIKF